MSEYLGMPEECIQFLFNQPRDKMFSIEEFKNKRSQRANRFCWECVGKLAKALKSSKEEVYFEELKKYGQFDVVNILAEVQPKRYFKYFEVLSEFEYQGARWQEVAVYLGSSQYDTKEMSEFIDGIVSDCEEQGISTLPPWEIERLKEMWKP